MGASLTSGGGEELRQIQQKSPVLYKKFLDLMDENEDVLIDVDRQKLMVIRTPSVVERTDGVYQFQRENVKIMTLDLLTEDIKSYIL